MKLNLCYAGDFETTTDENDVRVWAYSLCNIENPTEFIYGTSIDEFFDICKDPNYNYKIWFHNLKFDGAYIISYLFKNGYTWISDQYYSIVVYFKVGNKEVNKVEFFDSLKIFPNFSVENVAKAFALPISKLKIDYHKTRPEGYELDESEIAYIRNDVEIMARALKEMFSRGLTKMTIASNAIKNLREDFRCSRKIYPILNEEVDSAVRKSYKGGFTYVNETWAEKEVASGVVLDVNSLYPSCMFSPYLLPFGHPKPFDGEYQEDTVYPLYVQSITCIFELKPGKIPSIQIKNSPSFMPNEYIKSSDGKFITLFLTTPDYELFKSQYYIYQPSYNGGWKFKGTIGNFDPYINRWMEQKIKAGKEGNAPLKTISKLMLNSAYGKLGTSIEGRKKAPLIDDTGTLRFINTPPEKREPLYVPSASFITAYGRQRTITTSQYIKDYTIQKYGQDLYFYSDTDSIHAGLTDEDLEELKDIIKIDDFKLGYWAKESEFTRAYYIRQKCYIEEIDGKVNVTVAGLPKYLAPLVTFANFKKGFTTKGLTIEEMRQLAKQNGATDEEIEKIHHKLRYKYVDGGVLLVDTDFTIK